MNALSIASAALGFCLPQQPPKNSTVAELLPRVRAALDVDSTRPMLQVSGRSQRFGLPAPFRWTFDPGGSFLREFKGAFAQTTGFDGSRTWCQEVRSPSFPVLGAEQERLWALAWVWSGSWCQEAGPFELELQQPAAGESTLTLRYQLRRGRLHGEIQLHGQTLFPMGMSYSADSGGGHVLFSQWQKTDTPPLPHRVRVVDGNDETVEYNVGDARIWKRTAPAFADPRQAGTGMGFLEDNVPEIATQLTTPGPWLVQPLVDGKSIGWFLLDPSSPHSFLTRAAGEQLGYRSFASPAHSSPITGGRKPFYQGRSLQLGSLLFEGPMYLEVEDLQSSPGEPLAGLLGWEVFLRAVVRVDTRANQVQLHDPLGFEEEHVTWIPMTLVGRVAHLTGRVNGEREILLRFDPREIAPSARLRSTEFPVLSLSLAGRQLEVPPQELPPASLPRGTPWVAGTVGPAALPAGILLFDYPRARLGYCAPAQSNTSPQPTDPR